MLEPDAMAIGLTHEGEPVFACKLRVTNHCHRCARIIPSGRVAFRPARHTAMRFAPQGEGQRLWRRYCPGCVVPEVD